MLIIIDLSNTKYIIIATYIAILADTFAPKIHMTISRYVTLTTVYCTMTTSILLPLFIPSNSQVDCFDFTFFPERKQKLSPEKRRFLMWHFRIGSFS